MPPVLGQGGLAVDHGDEAGFLAFQEFLDHHPRAGGAEGVAAEHVGDGGFGLGQAHRHDHALAGGQAVGLDHDRCALLPHVLQRFLDVGVHGVVRGGDAVAGEEVLGEGLAAFQLRGGSGGAEDAVALRAERVDHAGDQRAFGADHGHRDALAIDEIEQAMNVAGIDRDIAALGLGRGAGVARGDQYFGDAHGLRQLPGQGVFAAAGTDDENFHGHILRVCVCRMGCAQRYPS
jgi:hypothetical protein